MNARVNSEGTVAVSLTEFWQPMSTCPPGVKVQLLGGGGVAVYANFDGKEPFWKGWAPAPKVPAWMHD